MRLFQTILVIFTLLINFVIVPPSWADTPKLTQTPEYTEVNQSLNELLSAKVTPGQSDYTPEQIEQRIGELSLQKYILETALEWGQCHNQTGQILAVYAHKGKKQQEPKLYYLGDGEVTDNDWNCDGVYLPAGVKIAGLTTDNIYGQELAEPLALKIVPGTQLTAKTNPEGTVQLNVRPAKIFKAGESNWSIPSLSIADVNSQAPNAPVED
jgi:hypothetical protein